MKGGCDTIDTVNNLCKVTICGFKDYERYDCAIDAVDKSDSKVIGSTSIVVTLWWPGKQTYNTGLATESAEHINNSGVKYSRFTTSKHLCTARYSIV